MPRLSVLLIFIEYGLDLVTFLSEQSASFEPIQISVKYRTD